MSAEDMLPEIETEEDLTHACMALSMLLPADRREVTAVIIGRVIQFARRRAIEDYKAGRHQ